MKLRKPSPPIFSRTTKLAIALAACLPATFTQAASTDISNDPLSIKTRVRPNLIIGYDDSGSMDSEMLFQTSGGFLWWNTTDRRFFGRDESDTLVLNNGVGPLNFNQSGIESNSNAFRFYAYLFPLPEITDAHSNGYRVLPPTSEFAFAFSSDYNSQYYNPKITYRPWNNIAAGSTFVVSTTTRNAKFGAAASYLGNLTSPPTFNLASSNPPSTSSVDINKAYTLLPGMRAPSGARICDASNCGGTTLTLAADSVVPGGKVWLMDKVPNYQFATYYLKDPNGTDGVGPDGAKLRKYVVNSTSPEAQNFANWFSYYRSRRMAINAALDMTITTLGGLRLGYSTMSNVKKSAPTDVSMVDIPAANQTGNANFLKSIFKVVPVGATPTLELLDFIGQQYKRSDASAPITQACQLNSALVVTDGFVSDPQTAGAALATGNVDGDAGNKWTQQYSKTGTVKRFPYSDAAANTLADIAMKYYSAPLRNLAAGQVPINTMDNSPGADRNPDLHMTTYALGFGVKGKYFGTNSPIVKDPYNNPPDWSTIYPCGPLAPCSIDDLWHATLNGRGAMYAANDPLTTVAGLKAAFADVLARVGSAAAVAVSNANVTSTSNMSYATAFNSGSWSGDLVAMPIDPATGVPTTTKLWSAAELLDARDLTADPRFIVTQRNQYQSGDTNQGLVFNVRTDGLGLDIQQQRFLTNTPANASVDAISLAAIVNYLRGDQSLEATQFRIRSSRMGDCVNAEPIFVESPSMNYNNAGYAQFKTAQAGRAKMVYQACNDGMLHAFNAANGREEWAFVPYMVMSRLNNLTSIAGFVHRPYVDATPVVGDIDTNKTYETDSSPPIWRTMLVGGLGGGGVGYYALNVTDPIPTSELNAAQKVLWSFPNRESQDPAFQYDQHANRVGYGLGRPIITQIVRNGVKRWVVIVASGYNNNAQNVIEKTDIGFQPPPAGDGGGYLFVLDAKTGKLIRQLSTGVGTQADPSGLAKISGFAKDYIKDNTVEYVYGGDLKGNLWRFDLTAQDAAQWNVKKLATLTDGSGAPQPITSEPEIREVDGKPLVLVGTGRYLGDSDIPGGTGANSNASQKQSMYAILDDKSVNPTVVPLRSNLVEQTLTVGGDNNRTASALPVDFSTKRGWFMDLPDSGERSASDPAIALGTLTFTTVVPNSDPCSAGGKSFAYTVDLLTGGRPAANSGLSSIPTGQFLGNALASRPLLVKLPDGRLEAIIRKSDATTIGVTIPTAASGGQTKRINWREVLRK
jgi:type IV pilus assembly protein PilY1